LPPLYQNRAMVQDFSYTILRIDQKEEFARIVPFT
jgi:hypothetical protein